MPGTTAAETVLPQLAASLRDNLFQRATIAAQVEQVRDAHPLAGVLTSMPGVGVRTAARILLGVGDASSFPLAAYAGRAPVTRRSGILIRPAPISQRQQTERALFLSAFAALSCIARRRIDVLYAMTKTKTDYQTRVPKAA